MDRAERPWLSSYEPEVPPTLDYPPETVDSLLKSAAARFGNRTAISFFGRRTNYRELLRRSLQFAHNIRKLGLRKGDRVALMLPNMPAYVVAYYGTFLAGGVVAQTNPLYTERELEAQLADCGARWIVCLDLLYARVRSVKPRTPLQAVIVTGIADDLPAVKRWLYPWMQKRKKAPIVKIPPNEPAIRLYSWLDTAEAPDDPVHNAPDDLAVLQYTGGTTGRPKGAMLTHANLTANVRQCRAWLHRAREGEEVALGAVPFFHVYGMTVAMNFAVSIGATMTLIPKFEPDLLLGAIRGTRPTMFPGAPTMYLSVLKHPKHRPGDLASIRVCVSGSAPLPLDVQQEFELKSGGKLVEGYGLSEASPVTHANPIWGENRTGTIGLPWPDTDCRIVDTDTGEPLGPGQIGELQIRGPQVMRGYWNRPEETAAAFDDGWLRTGDLASMDEQGYFRIVERLKDMINCGGFKVYPREVEEVLFEHPAVREAAVVGVPDGYRGETVKAFVVRQSGVTEEELNRFCRERLAAYKVPRQYEFVDALPKSAVGKVLRRLLKERTESGSDGEGKS